MINKQVKYGAVISYVLIILNATYGLFLTPYIIGQIGDASYGVYKTVSSFTASLMVLDLGLGGTMMRYVAKYRADREEDRIPGFVGMGVIQAGAVCLVIAAVTGVLYFFLDDIYRTGLTLEELSVAKELYVFLALGMIAHVVENLLNGVISGYNRFIFANGIKVVRMLVRILALVLFLAVFPDPLVLVLIDLVCTVAFLAIEFMYLIFKLKLKVCFDRWDKGIFAESFKYTILMFLTSIVAQANSNFSNVAIGASISSTAVTVYSMALLIFGMYEQMSTAISGVMLPTVTQALKHDDETYTKTLSIVVSAGRVQFIILGAAFVGFAVLGKTFVALWLGEGFEDVYYLCLILLGPALLELCVNVCLSILRAKNMLGFRTGIITASTVANIVITLVGVPYVGYYAAAIGTACSFLFGSVITMGIYYYKKLRINILKLYVKIFGKVWICLLLSAAVAVFAASIIKTAIYSFAAGLVGFCVIYAVTLLAFGLDKSERESILSKVRKRNG